jgi:hypothetical protein
MTAAQLKFATSFRLMHLTSSARAGGKSSAMTCRSSRMLTRSMRMPRCLVADLQLSRRSSSTRFFFPRHRPTEFALRGGSRFQRTGRLSALRLAFGTCRRNGPKFRVTTLAGFPALQTYPWLVASVGATAGLANSSKKNGMRATGCAFRGLARMLLWICKRSDSSRINNARGRSDASQHSILHLERQAIPPVWHCALPHVRGTQ